MWRCGDREFQAILTSHPAVNHHAALHNASATVDGRRPARADHDDVAE
jgi:hypothetical protein